jgi:Putative prokaryotic signal transducing protein
MGITNRSDPRRCTSLPQPAPAAVVKSMPTAVSPDTQSLCPVLNSDDLKERQRLAETYRAMSDGELLKLASNPEALTDTAWETLEDELDRRHLELPAKPPEAHQEMDFRRLITIRQFRDLPEALLAKGSLESAGIQCFLRDENLVRLDWFISNFVGGVKLCVNPEDAENATRLLDEPILEGMYVHGVGLYEQPRCPHCQSLDINFQELDRPVAFLSAFLRVPMPIQRKGWRCHSCNAEWEDEGRQV